MAKSIVLREHPYVLESDRGLPVSEQTIFHIIPKTVKSVAVSASRYAKVTVQNRRKNRTDIDSDAMIDAENHEFVEVVGKIENYFISANAPEEGYEYFLALVKDNPKFVKLPNEETILIKETKNKADLLQIYWSMHPKDSDELSRAASEYAVLKEGEKNE